MADAPAGPVKIAVFGPDAESVAARSNGIAPAGYSVVGVRSDVPWGKASAELVKLIYDDHALAMIATDRNASHLAEQLAVKAFVPLIAMSADRTLFVGEYPVDLPAAGRIGSGGGFRGACSGGGAVRPEPRAFARGPRRTQRGRPKCDSQPITTA